MTFLSGRHDSNVRPSVPKTDALPAALRPDGGESGIRTRGTVARTSV